jgi:aryl-alcohol dehydrogenase-like predicted oxidoreductase
MPPLRPLGRSGLEIAPLVMGGNAFGWTADETASHSVLDAFVDAGFNMVDTADVYSKWVPGNVGGESETIIGSWLKSRGQRDRVLIATKVAGEIEPGRKGLSAAHIKTAVEASLRRLQTDYIDLYQAHYSDPSMPVEETLGAFGDLIAEGKVRSIGLSNHSPEEMRQALAVSAAKDLPRYDTLQPLYNLYDRQEFEQAYAPLCRAEGVGVISYSALASGFLTGKYRSEADVLASKRQRSNSRYLNARGLGILGALDAVAARTGARQAQVALAWILAQLDITAPIASATSVAQMDELAEAVRLTLDAEALDLLNTASAYPSEAA